MALDKLGTGHASPAGTNCESRNSCGGVLTFTSRWSMTSKSTVLFGKRRT